MMIVKIRDNRLLAVLCAVAAVLLAVLLCSCERRDLYVYGSEFRSVTLSVDWRQYVSKDPDGMTTWFWPVADSDHYRFTTASVRRYDLYLSGGTYQGAVIDYSPEEYSRQEFVGTEHYATACVVAAPEAHQPLADAAAAPAVARAAAATTGQVELWGDAAYGRELPSRQPTGLWTVSCQPEEMALDTLCNMAVSQGEYGDYIPYEERDDYQQTLTVREFRATPRSLVWRMYVRIAVQGINNLWLTEGSLAGLADGHYLGRDVNTDTPCLVNVDGWNVVRTDHEGNGYIETYVSTFGLRPSSIHGLTPVGDGRGEHVEAASGELRLNLRLTLRDRATVLCYHFDVGNHVLEFDEDQMLRLRLDTDDFGADGDLGDPIVLPYVEPYDGAGFGADVTPWDDGAEVDVPV